MNYDKWDKKIDGLISNQIVKYALKDLNRLYKTTNNKYVLFRIAKYEFEKKLYDLSKEHFNILLNDPDYCVCSNYYLAAIANRQRDYKLAFEYLEKIVNMDTEYKSLASGLYSEVLYKLKRSSDVIKFYEEQSEKGIVDAQTYYYASKSYAIRNDHPDHIFNSLKCIRKAIELDDNNIEYHDFLRKMYLSNNIYSGAISETKKLIFLDSPYKNELSLMLPELEVKENRKSEAIYTIKKNISDGIVSYNQSSLYFELLTRCNDFKEAEIVSKDIVGEDKRGLDNYLKLVRMYNREYLCDKSIELCEYLDDKKIANIDILAAEAEALIQLGKYEEAKKVLHKVIKHSVYNKFYRMLALCCYLEGDLNSARRIMDTINANPKSEIDTFLRNRLYVDDQSCYMHESLFNSLLSGYNFNLVYDHIGYRLSIPSHMSVLEPGINIRDFLLKMNDKILYLDPSYVLDRDTFLVECDEEVGLINDKPTKYFIVDAMCGEGILSVKPVIPTKEAESNFKRVHF